MIIRSAQQAILAEPGRRAFLADLAQRVRKRGYPGATELSDAELHARIAAAAAKAERFGFRSAAMTAAFVTLMFGVGPELDAHPMIGAILRERDLPPRDRLAVLTTIVSTRTLHAARSDDEAAAWARVMAEASR